MRERLDELLSAKEQLTVSEASKQVIEKELYTLQQVYYIYMYMYIYSKCICVHVHVCVCIITVYM